MKANYGGVDYCIIHAKRIFKKDVLLGAVECDLPNGVIADPNGIYIG